MKHCIIDPLMPIIIASDEDIKEKCESKTFILSEGSGLPELQNKRNAHTSEVLNRMHIRKMHTDKYNQEEERFDSILCSSVNCPDSLKRMKA